MIPTQYVKKVWSWNPTKYKYITLSNAIKGYEEYIKLYIKSEIKSTDKNAVPKTFNQWLWTEI